MVITSHICEKESQHFQTTHEGKLLWAKVTFATFAGIIEPIFEPYPYIPYSPKVSVHSKAQFTGIADGRGFLDPNGNTKS